jgi:hypothetical protein
MGYDRFKQKVSRLFVADRAKVVFDPFPALVDGAGWLPA